MSSNQYLARGKSFFFSDAAEKKTKLPSGVYQILQTRMGELYLQEKEITPDALFELEGSVAQKINTSIRMFLDPKVKNGFEKYDMVYKRGVMLYGPPGTGKTSIVNLVINTAIKNDMIVLLNPPSYSIPSIIEQVRSIEKTDRAFMVVWEEFERMLEDEEEEMLDLLDGVHQMDNTFYIATTNYIKNVPSRIRNRPSRFAEVIEVGSPNAALRREYLKAKIHKDDKINMEEWVEKTSGFVLDHLKDLIISVLVLKIPLDDAIAKIRILQEEDKKQYEESSKKMSESQATIPKYASSSND